MTSATLRALSCKDLAQMAKKESVAGWHAMRKEELIRALVLVGRRNARTAQSGLRSGGARATAASSQSRRQAANASAKSRRVSRRLKKFQSAQQILKLLSTQSNGNGKTAGRDRLVAMVRGPYWLHASWELRHNSVQRAAAAMGKAWHTARPVLRLLAAGSNQSVTNTRQILRDIPIHGGVSHWYVDVSDPPASYQLDIGYLGENGKYYSLARSNTVRTPAPGQNDSLDENWDEVAQNCDRIYAMSGGVDDIDSVGDLKELFEERLRRPMGSPMVTRFGTGADIGGNNKELDFHVDAEMIVFGTTAPNAHVSFRGEPIELRDDGSFTIRVAMPERRQVIPVVATRADGVEQRTIVLAVERNTKVMETLIRQPEEQI